MIVGKSLSYTLTLFFNQSFHLYYICILFCFPHTLSGDLCVSVKLWLLLKREMMGFPLAIGLFFSNTTINNGRAVSRSYANSIVYSMST